jgi:hypothetical protein
MQASGSNHRVMKAFDFISDVQHAPLEINNHQVISRALEQCFLDLMFERSMPPFKIKNKVWFRHRHVGSLASLTDSPRRKAVFRGGLIDFDQTRNRSKWAYPFQIIQTEGRPMTQNDHHHRGGNRLGAPLIWIITVLLVLIAIGLLLLVI